MAAKWLPQYIEGQQTAIVPAQYLYLWEKGLLVPFISNVAPFLNQLLSWCRITALCSEKSKSRSEKPFTEGPEKQSSTGPPSFLLPSSPPAHPLSLAWNTSSSPQIPSALCYSTGLHTTENQCFPSAGTVVGLRGMS